MLCALIPAISPTQTDSPTAGSQQYISQPLPSLRLPDGTPESPVITASTTIRYCYILDSPQTFSDILRLQVPSRKLHADAYTMFHEPLDILRWAPSGQCHADAYAKSPILIFTIWHTFLYLSIHYPESLIIYLTLCPYHMLHWATNISLHGSYLILPSLLRSGLISDTYLSSKPCSR